MIPLVEARSVSKRFVRELDYAEKLARMLGANLEAEAVHAVDRVDLAIMPGEVVGLVGKSGCGKSTLGRMMAGIMPPSDGEILWQGQDRRATTPAAEARRRALEPDDLPGSHVVAQSAQAGRRHHWRGAGRPRHRHAARKGLRMWHAMMQRVGLDPSFRGRYPHQFSGGQRQRIGIARALAVKPQFIVCDESVAALDVSIQAQVINLFMELRRDLGLTYLFISHDLGVVKHISDRVAIMYLGRIVESAPADAFFAQPNHPYTVALLDEVPTISNRRRVFSPSRAKFPSPLHPPSGCHFHPRCPHAFDRCSREAPELQADRIRPCQRLPSQRQSNGSSANATIAAL